MVKFNRNYQFFSKNFILVVCRVSCSAFLLSWKMMKGLEILFFFPQFVTSNILFPLAAAIIIKFEFARYLELYCYYYFNYRDLSLSRLEYNILGSHNYDSNCRHHFIYSIFMEFSLSHY